MKFFFYGQNAINIDQLVTCRVLTEDDKTKYIVTCVNERHNIDKETYDKLMEFIKNK